MNQRSITLIVSVHRNQQHHSGPIHDNLEHTKQTLDSCLFSQYMQYMFYMEFKNSKGSP